MENSLPSKGLICACAFAGLVSKELASAIAALFKSQGKELLFCDDLCRMAVEESNVIKDFCNGDVGVFACRKRAIGSILNYAGAQAQFKFFDLRTEASEISSELNLTLTSDSLDSPKARGTWKPWYPTIDTLRCVNCGKCVDFCLFGVYEKADDNVRVKNPRACKDQCPACARMCPKSAIVFAKCTEDFISGGEGFAEKNGDDKGDFYSALKRRRAVATSPFKKNTDK